MHLLADAASPWLIGVASDQIGLRTPVLVTGCLLAAAGVVLWRAGQLWKQISGRRAVRLGLVAVGRRVVRYALDRHR